MTGPVTVYIWHFGLWKVNGTQRVKQSLPLTLKLLVFCYREADFIDVMWRGMDHIVPRNPPWGPGISNYLILMYIIVYWQDLVTDLYPMVLFFSLDGCDSYSELYVGAFSCFLCIMSYLLDISRHDLLNDIQADTVRQIITAVSPSSAPIEILRRLVRCYGFFKLFQNRLNKINVTLDYAYFLYFFLQLNSSFTEIITFINFWGLKSPVLYVSQRLKFFF